MDITIKDDEFRFGVRTIALIFNNDLSKVLVQIMNGKHYMFPGGRLHVLEDSKSALKRELVEELNLKTHLRLKYTCESISLLPNGKKYHEIGFYYITKINKDLDCLKSLDKNDGDIEFVWVNINELDKYNIVPINIVNEIMLGKAFTNGYKHLIYNGE